MSDANKEGLITVDFNILLFLFLAAVGIFKFLFSASGGAAVAAGKWAIEGVILSCVLDAAFVFVVLLISAFFIKEFWGRLISKLVPIRSITYQEAVSIVLIASLLLSR